MDISSYCGWGWGHFLGGPLLHNGTGVHHKPVHPGFVDFGYHLEWAFPWLPHIKGGGGAGKEGLGGLSLVQVDVAPWATLLSTFVSDLLRSWGGTGLSLEWYSLRSLWKSSHPYPWRGGPQCALCLPAVLFKLIR